jgi:hypothetical protein
MVVEVRDLNVNKLFKIAKINSRGKFKKWFKRLNLAPTNWTKLHTLKLSKHMGT